MRRRLHLPQPQRRAAELGEEDEPALLDRGAKQQDLRRLAAQPDRVERGPDHALA